MISWSKKIEYSLIIIVVWDNRSHSVSRKVHTIFYARSTPIPNFDLEKERAQSTMTDAIQVSPPSILTTIHSTVIWFIFIFVVHSSRSFHTNPANFIGRCGCFSFSITTHHSSRVITHRPIVFLYSNSCPSGNSNCPSRSSSSSRCRCCPDNNGWSGGTSEEGQG